MAFASASWPAANHGHVHPRRIPQLSLRLLLAMRACIQRVSAAQVTVAAEVVGQIGPGLVVLLGVEQGDTAVDLEYIFEKTVGLRVFEDAAGKMNRALAEVGGELLVVSQFTLLGDVRRGKRPSFDNAAPPEVAERLYEDFVAQARSRGIMVATGRFRAMMQVTLTNDGPVTILLDSRKQF